ncbi:MAG: hypothetical protein AB7G13_28630 [Lautropia sp.]
MKQLRDLSSDHVGLYVADRLEPAQESRQQPPDHWSASVPTVRIRHMRMDMAQRFVYVSVA